MKILTNEYLCNVPDFKKPAKGGPANFSRLFFNYLKKDRADHEWIGVVLRELDKNSEKMRIRKMPDRQNHHFAYKFSLPFDLVKKVLQAKKISAPEKIFHKPVVYLSEFIKKISPDVVFLNGFSIGNWVILKAAKLAGIPIIVQHAGIWTIELNAYKHLYSKAGLKIMELMYKDSSLLTNAEIFLNSFCKKIFQKNVLKKTTKIKKITKIIPLPVDFSFFKKYKNTNSSFKFDKKNFNIGVIARWDRIKNHEAVADLAALISAQNLPWKIHSITKIPRSKKNAQLKKKYRQHVDVIDHVSKEGVADFIHNIDLLILPSKFETTGAVVLEAIASGKPAAISSSVGLADDYLKNGGKKWIINFNDADEAISQISRIKGYALPKKLTQQLISKHNHNKIFKQYLSLLKKII